MIVKNTTGRAASMGVGLLTGVMVSLGCTILGAMIGAFLITHEYVEATSIGYCSMVTLLVSPLLGSTTAMKRIKHRKMYVCMLSGALYYAVLLSVTTLFFGGQYRGMGVTALLVVTGCGASMLLEIRQPRKRSAHKIKIRR